MGFTIQEMSSEISGPIRSAILIHGGALKLFSKHQQNDLCRDALKNGGEMWCQIFLPKRFTPYVYQAPFNYNAGRGRAAARYESWKEKITGVACMPGVLSGEARHYAIMGHRVEARSTANKSLITIRFPMPAKNGFVYMSSPKNPMGRILRTVPTWEVKRIGEWVEKALAALIANKRIEQDLVNSSAMAQRLANQGQPRKRGRPPGSRNRKAA